MRPRNVRFTPKSRHRMVCSPPPGSSSLSGLPWFAGEPLPQRRQSIERGGRQWAFLDCGERILELLRRCHADQYGSYRRMRDCKPRSSFGQARGKPVLD